jgi:hypothetical protein
MRIAALLVLALGCGSDKQKSPPPTAGSAGSGSGSASATGSAAPTPSKPSAFSTIDTPTVGGKGFDPIPADGPFIVVATKEAILIDGKSIVPVIDGEIDPAEKMGGAAGLSIPKVTKFISDLVTIAGGPRETLIALDKAMPYSLFNQLVFSTKDAGVTRFAIAAKSDAGDIILRFVLPTTLPPSEPPDDAQPVVTLSGDQIVLWSMSGKAGTVASPKAKVAHDRAGLDELAREAAEIAASWPKTKSIFVIVDGNIPMQRVADVVAAVRTDPNGTPLFDVLFAAGAGVGPK